MPFRSFQRLAAFVAAVPMIIPFQPQAASADDRSLPVETPSKRAPLAGELRPVDVALGSANLLRGRMLNAQGQPQTNSQVVVFQSRTEVLRVTTSDVGEFHVQLPRAGVYLLRSERSVLLVRAWTVDAAPPNAVATVTLSDRSNVRGQNEECPPEERSHGNGLMLVAIAGALTAAIVIPILLIDKLDDDAPPSSP